jgi:hypothetical protein
MKDAISASNLSASNLQQDALIAGNQLGTKATKA